MSFRIIKPGFLATIQDAGRYGYAENGISQSGAADEHAYQWANHLLDNDFNAAVVEVTLGNCEWQALDDMEIIITGADLSFSIDDKIVPLWQTISIKQSETLRCQIAEQGSGIRSLIAVKGGFQTMPQFGSRAVNLREQIGEEIKAGYTLITLPLIKQAVRKRAIPYYFKPDYGEPLILRLIPCYQYEQFSQKQVESLLNQDYLINSASDRVGCRLHGQAIQNVPAKMVSEGIAYGSVEITTDGQPIILLKDRPTIGGYPKIGTVLSLDLSKLAQRQASTQVRFELMTLESAQQKRQQFNRFFNISRSV
ncbi:MAG: biotin-dependent carboxyltransferase [Piscirickettsiaceae bacterium]|nr:biotin-dependent carboxyltransferase [Piscirickettsiaceae bacterium]